MIERKVFSHQLNGKKLEIEINNLAEQANASVWVRYGETVVFVSVVGSEKENKDQDFFPLSVEFEEKYYAAGKILGSRYVRREGKPTEEAVLAARFIDRAIRPLFPQNYKKEVQVIVTCLSWDGENDPDLFGLIGASVALGVSEIPWQGPVAVVRVAKTKEGFVLNPTYSQREEAEFEIALAGVKSEKGELLINMIEMEGKEVLEEEVLKAVDFAKDSLLSLLAFEEEIISKEGKKKWVLEKENPEIISVLRERFFPEIEKTFRLLDKKEKEEKFEEIKEEIKNFLEENYPQEHISVIDFLTEAQKELLEKMVLQEGKRPDGRGEEDIRPIECQIDVLKRAHGSALFVRGKTKSLSVVTLGSPGDMKLLETMEHSGKKRFMHHYNFPPYCSGEIKPIRGPSRREIGHGMLAEKALLAVLPSFDEFPYTIRVVTEILSSNGSTSMASVSSSSLALMQAGVPIKSLVTGIALGLVMKDFENYKILTDIQGPEDHYGGMDFKVAGTRKGITAIQLDVKVRGLTPKMIRKVLERAKRAREKILDIMEKTISEPRKELSPFAPRVLMVKINPEKIREVIGPGGKVINEIIEECGVSIDIEEDGRIFVTAEKEEAAQKAVDWIKNITREIKIGELFYGKVKRILNFGAIVEILPGQEGLVHISQLAPFRVKKVEDVVKVGDVIPVKVVAIDELGRISLSLKDAKKELSTKKKTR